MSDSGVTVTELLPVTFNRMEGAVRDELSKDPEMGLASRVWGLIGSTATDAIRNRLNFEIEFLQKLPHDALAHDGEGAVACALLQDPIHLGAEELEAQLGFDVAEVQHAAATFPQKTPHDLKIPKDLVWLQVHQRVERHYRIK